MKFNKRQGRDKRSKTDKGCFPSITLNNNGVVVEVNHQQGTNWMFCRVGHVRSWEIKWGHPAATPATPPKKVFYGSGANPQVSLNDNNTLVEVHKGKSVYRRRALVVRIELAVTMPMSCSQSVAMCIN